MRNQFLSFLSVVIVIISSCENRTTVKDEQREEHDTTESKKSIITNSNPVLPIDADGNVYDTVRIGTQVWMKQNLRTAHYRDGSPITEIEDTKAWVNIHETRSRTPAWCYFNGDTSMNHKYGKLYNWYAVDDPRNICPIGWHVPSEPEWTQLSNTLGGEWAAGGKLKARTLWRAPNTDATNSSGFTALPAEIRHLHGGFSDSDAPGYSCTFWSSTQYEVYEYDAYAYGLGSASSALDKNSEDKSNGFSVRCIRDNKSP